MKYVMVEVLRWTWKEVSHDLAAELQLFIVLIDMILINSAAVLNVLLAAY